MQQEDPGPRPKPPARRAPGKGARIAVEASRATIWASIITAPLIPFIPSHLQAAGIIAIAATTTAALVIAFRYLEEIIISPNPPGENQAGGDPKNKTQNGKPTSRRRTTVERPAGT